MVERIDRLPAGVLIRHGVSAFGWLSPGELRVFTPGDQSAARSWVTGSPSA